MKLSRIFLTATILISLAISLQAEEIISSSSSSNKPFSIGLEGTMLNINSSKQTTIPNGTPSVVTETREGSFTLAPYFAMRTSDLLELTPFLYWGMSWSTDYRQQQTGGGFGLYFHLINRNFFSLSMGPKAIIGFETSPSNVDYEKWFNMNYGVSAPLNLDFLLGTRFGIRLSSDMLSISWNISKSKLNAPDATEDKNISYNTTILGNVYENGLEGLIPALSVFFSF